VTTQQKIRRARQLRRRKRPFTVREIAEELGVSPGTAHRYVNPKAAERYRIATRERKRREKAGEE
jgi:DNA-binding IclR family transcriptional regulator